MSNLELWNRVKTTDPEFTKQVSQRGGYTSISPQYQILKATEQFGTYGEGWGFETCDMNLDHIESTGLVMVKAVFFYLSNNKKITFPINNAWAAKQGSRIDADFMKKAETNTMSKALSKLGFSADVFMGEFDNPDYVEHITNEIALEKAENKIDELASQEADYNEWVASSIKTLETAQSENELRKVYKGLVRKANLRKDDVSVVKFAKAKDKRKGELSE